MKTIIISAALLLSAAFSAKGQNAFDTVVKALKQHRTITAVLSDKQLSRYIGPLVAAEQDSGVSLYAMDYDKVYEFFPKYRLRLHIWGDSVMAFTIVSNADSTQSFSHTNNGILNRFINHHNKKYGSSWKVSDYLAQKQYGFFGIGCGDRGGLTDGVLEIIDQVKKRDVIALRHMASAFSPVTRTYGSIGLWLLSTRDKGLNNELQKIIVINQRSSVKIWSCTGCLVGVEAMSDLLRPEDMARYKLYFEGK